MKLELVHYNLKTRQGCSVPTEGTIHHPGTKITLTFSFPEMALALFPWRVADDCWQFFLNFQSCEQNKISVTTDSTKVNIYTCHALFFLSVHPAPCIRLVNYH
jgi:hypothetical protein